MGRRTGPMGKCEGVSVRSIRFVVEMNELTYAFMFSGSGWMSGGSSTW